MIAGRGDGAFASFERPFPGMPEGGDGVLGFVSFLLVAGSETTRSAIAIGLHHLLENPDQLERLRAEPSLITSATEEILRVSAPARAMQRTVTADTELGDKQLRAGDRVVIVHWAANHDPAVFEDPERFVIDRAPNDHVSFGFGSHYCLGANVARMEVATVVGRLVERLPDLALDPDDAPVRTRSPIVNGMIRLPVIFTPQPVAGATAR